MRTVCLHGPESTGKTTLASELAEHFGAMAVPEYGRLYCEIFGNECDMEDLRAIRRGHDLLAEAARRKAKGLIVFDTDAVMTAVWADVLLGQRPADLDRIDDPADLYLLCDIDVPFVADGIAISRTRRRGRRCFAQTRRELEQRGPALRHRHRLAFRATQDRRGRDHDALSGAGRAMTPTTTRPTEIRALAGARAIPPLILVLYHFCEGHHYRNFKAFDLLVGHGYLWVEFFFALSGFILTYVYGARVAAFWRGRAYKDFLIARLSRLYPLHLAMLLFILFLMLVLNGIAAATHTVSIYQEAYHPIVTWPSFVANLFLVQAWNILPYLTWNGRAGSSASSSCSACCFRSISCWRAAAG